MKYYFSCDMGMPMFDTKIKNHILEHEETYDKYIFYLLKLPINLIFVVLGFIIEFLIMTPFNLNLMYENYSEKKAKSGK